MTNEMEPIEIPNPNDTDHESSALYIQNKETGEWEVRNPSGSVGYNYLYRDDLFDI
ncbi:MAG: hypothetical protein ACM3SY_17655 [Candidatus Omnitrophota bacterium]